MALDPSIPLQARGIQLESPIAQAGNVLGILNALGQQRMRDLQMQQLIEQQRRDTALRDALAKAGSDPNAMVAAALQAGDPKTALALMKNAREAEQATANTKLAQARTGEITGRQTAINQLGAALNPATYATDIPATTEVFGPGSQPPPGQDVMVGGKPLSSYPPEQQAAIRGAMSAGSEPYRGIVPNPATLDALRARIAPQQYVTQSMRPPPAGTTTQLSKLIQERAMLPPGDPRIKIYDDAIAKASTHQAPVNVYSGSLTAGVDAQGRPVFVQPSGQPGVPPRPVEGFYPPPKPADTKAADARAEAEQTVESVRARISRLSQLVQQNPTAVGAAGMVRRGVETVGGIAESLGGPSIPTPAIDFQNEQSLLLADVRKLVEKDPNLSNQERETLKQTLGSGVTQTPSSSLRAMNNVMEYVERKKLTGASRERALERRAPPVGTVQSGYRFKGGDPAQQSNWEKVP